MGGEIITRNGERKSIIRIIIELGRKMGEERQ